jgi:soluble lytic murein transglycosylase-like protein
MLARGQYFLLSKLSAASFDGRYFGPLSRESPFGSRSAAVDVAMKARRSPPQTAVIAGAPPAWTSAANACDLEQWQPQVKVAAERLQVNAALIRAVSQVESAACEQTHGQPTTSSAGAKGLMPVIPATWDRYRHRLGLGAGRECLPSGSY